MITPRRAMHFALVAIALGTALAAPVTARADQAYQRFIPLLIELDGWQAKKPDGMTMEMPNNSMTTATRDYQRGPAQAHAGVVIGEAAAAAMAPIQAGMKVETPDGHMITTTMHGLPVIKSYTAAQKNGALIVALGKEAVFTFSYTGIPEDEAMALAEKFDWKAIQAAAQAK